MPTLYLLKSWQVVNQRFASSPLHQQGSSSVGHLSGLKNALSPGNEISEGSRPRVAGAGGLLGS